MYEHLFLVLAEVKKSNFSCKNEKDVICFCYKKRKRLACENVVRGGKLRNCGLAFVTFFERLLTTKGGVYAKYSTQRVQVKVS